MKVHLSRTPSLAVALIVLLCGGLLTAPASATTDPLPYPARDGYRIKSIQPDSWADKDTIAGNNTGGVALNLVWAEWEPSRKPAPCAEGEELFDNHCFRVPAEVDSAIKDWSARGLVVTGVTYGTPAWARYAKPCSPAEPGFEVHCTPNQAADYARFAGMLARRYSGLRGHGRVADFVVLNEVNTNTWFDIGCGQGVPCDRQRWLEEISELYVAAYDRVVAEQPHAKVLISLDNRFGAELESPSAREPVLAGQNVLRALAARAGARQWRVAFHPYPKDLRRPEISADDFPYVTYGNLGVLAGWLAAEFPGSVAATDIQLTESGINSSAPSTPERQAIAVCDSFRAVLGTPGVTSHVYHRMRDHPDETGAGLALGLWQDNGAPKPAWTTWALANRADLGRGGLSCGFEQLPHTRLVRGFNPARGHWATSRLLPPGFTAQQSWLLLREPAAGTAVLYECGVGGHNLLTVDPRCEGLPPLGPVGSVHTAPAPGRTALYRCLVPRTGDHFVAADPRCEGHRAEALLGYTAA
ncbi:DUF5722 domain-containing protein [Crossiella sp. SN42]|uniref:DUF5722 domain-containing protein n=1 Tax=Crossiella sp. SN42 TaxID=2944808 RepID=UPI00207D5508|nr:DUF5722 domain-containing protein [Crossiella sp. SN42]MCO1577323.1 DUF5722 domain-containing protein [Crossiella sp. SN42]